MDSSIGQAAFDQALAFKQSVSVGAVIVTKMDGHAKRGGALSTVAATKSPVLYIGTGEHMDEFEVFDVKQFVSRLLGRRDLSGFVNRIQEAIPMDQQLEELQEKILKGTITLRIIYEQYTTMLKAGLVEQIISGIPMFNGKESPAAMIKRHMIIMDSMTNEELDSSNPRNVLNEQRIMRIAKGSGNQVKEVVELLESYKFLAPLIRKGLKVSRRGLSGNINIVQHLNRILPFNF